MFATNGGLTPADIAAVSGRNGDDGWGDGNGWWVLIILFALFGGWGNWGGANNGVGSQGYTNSDIQRGFDNAEVLSKLNDLGNGICSQSYDQLAQINGVNQNIFNSAYGIQNAIQQSTVDNMQNTNAIQTQLANCCCENREAIAQVRYDMATDTCAVTNAINQASQNIINNDNCNYRALHDEIVGIQMEAKNEKIAEQQAIISQLNLTASQRAQNDYLVSQLRPAPVPSFPVPNPYYGLFGGNNGCCN